VESMDEVLKIALEREIKALPLAASASPLEVSAPRGEEQLH